MGNRLANPVSNGVMRIPAPLAALCLCLACNSRAFACFCFSTPMCSEVQTLSGSHAVFVGRVVDVWPSRSMLASESTHPSLAALRRSILQRWQGSLSPAEERDVRSNADRGSIELRYGLLQRVRFVVTEVLMGPEIQEVYTDASSCGYSFQQGQVYLVNASRDGTRYGTSACSRTSSMESDDAAEDLKALRAWKSGRLLPRRIYGRIDREQLPSGIRVSLKNGEAEQVAPMGSDGRFSFDGLKPETYWLHVADERGSGERVIDLSRIGCFEAFPWFSDGWRIAGSPVETNVPQLVPLPEPPLLLPKPLAK
jgi:hypothetical protein